MNCTNCGTPLANDSSFCAACGTPKGAAPAAPVQPTVVNNTPYTANTAPVAQQNGLAIASMVVSLMTFLFCGGTLSFVGAILGHVALGQINRTGQSGKGMAVTGIIVGWAALGLALTFILLASTGLFAGILAAFAGSGY
jgi:hypothetical protein